MEVSSFKIYKKPEFWVTVLILLFTLIFSTVAFINWFSLLFFVGDLFFVHWLSIVATTFIAFMVPVYYVLKRKSPKRVKTLLRIHVFGNLLAFMLISIHFAQNTGRLVGLISRLGDGFALFLVLSIIVTTGLIERFGAKLKLVRYLKFVHSYAVVIFYLVLVFHVLEALP